MPDGDTLTPAAPVLCPECRVPLTPHALGPHLRQAHQYHFFRGAWRSPAAAATDCLAALLTAQPDPDAWRTLAAIARDRYGPDAAVRLAATLGAALDRLPEDERASVVGPLAALLASANGSSALAVALASDDSTADHHLALALLGRLAPPLEPILFQPAQALLLDRRLPAEDQLATAALLLRSVTPDDARAANFLQTLIGGLGKSRSIERLRQLEQQTGRHPAIDAVCARLEDRLRMTCPRCDAEMRRPEMIRHLWEEHQLVLEGRRVREPWSVIEDWVEVYQARPDPELLERCRVLAARIDPEQGLSKVQRMCLARGLADGEAKAALLEEAGENHAALCPSCFAEVPVPTEAAPFAVYERRGRLSSFGYSVEVSEKGLWTRLEVRTPAEIVFQGQEPGRRLTPGGATLLLVGPLVLLALVGSVVLPSKGLAGTVGFLLAAAAATYGAVLVGWRIEVPARDRARNFAWTLLGPRLHVGGFADADAGFAAGLADVCTGDGYGLLRAALLPNLLARTERALQKRQAPTSYLAPLRRLAIEDAAAGTDPVPAVADELARVFEGKLPLRYAERLLADWRADWWTAGNLARLRLLLCDRAFGAGFEVRSLLDAGQSSPALADVLDSEHPQRLAALRLLWSLRARRPWDRCGEAETAFQLAEDVSHGPLLARHPDLLLHQQESWLVVAENAKGKMGPARILLTARGLWLQDVEFVIPPRLVEVRGKMLGHELLMGERLFRGPDPLDDLAKRMERWFRYAFHEFLPATGPAADWKPPDRAAVMRAWGTVACPQCRKEVLPRVGQVAIALDEATP